MSNNETLNQQEILFMKNNIKDDYICEVLDIIKIKSIEEIMSSAYENNKFKLNLNLSFISLDENASILKNINKNYYSQLTLASTVIKDSLVLSTLLSDLSISDFFLYNIDLSGINVAEIAKEICSKIKFLLLSKLTIGNDTLNNLVLQSLLVNKNIKEITFSSLDISINGLNELSLLLSKNDISLERLCINSCDLSIQDFDEKQMNIFNCLSTNNTIIDLILTNCNIKKESILLFESLRSSKVVNLDLSQNKIGPEEFKELLVFLDNSNIKNLYLNNNFISDLGVFYLDAFMTKTINSKEKLNILELEDNNITNKGASIIASIIKDNYFYLAKLSLAYNSIDAAKIRDIANALVDYSKRNELLMGENFDLLFKFPNIGQIVIDIKRNTNMSDEEYKEVYLSLVDEEYNRFFKIQN